MADIVTVSSAHELVQEVVPDEQNDITDAGAKELWELWKYRHDNGADDDYLIIVQNWFAESDFGKRWPALFAKIEYDSDDNPDGEHKAAVMFRDARLIDINVVENGLYTSGDVSVTEALEVIDKTEDADFAMEEKGELWIPRSSMTIFEMEG